MGITEVIDKFGLSMLTNTNEISGDKTFLFKSNDGLFVYRKTISRLEMSKWFGNSFEEALANDVYIFFDKLERGKATNYECRE